MRAYIFFAVLVILAPAALFNPYWGLLSWTWISYFNPHEYTWGFTRYLPVGLIVTVPTLLGLVLTKKRRFPPLTRETILLFLLWLWFGVTTLNVYMSPAFTHHLKDTLYEFGLVSKILIMVFVALMLVIDSRRLRLWYVVTAGCFAFFALKSSIFGLFTGGEFRTYGPPHSMIQDNNDFGLAMNMALPMFLCLCRTETSRLLRWGFRLSIPLGIMAVILTYSRGALLGLIVLLFMWVIKSKYKVLAGLAILLALTIVFVAAPEKWTQRMETIRTAPETDLSAKARLNAWKFATDLALDHPIFGGGFETFTPQLYLQYNIAERHGPHSIYFQMLAEHGFTGLALFLGLICSCYWSCRRIIQRFAFTESCRYLAEYAKMAQVSFATFLVSGAFLGRAYFDLFYQLVATVILLRYLARKEAIELQAAEMPDAVIDQALVVNMAHS